MEKSRGQKVYAFTAPIIKLCEQGSRELGVHTGKNIRTSAPRRSNQYTTPYVQEVQVFSVKFIILLPYITYHVFSKDAVGDCE